MSDFTVEPRSQSVSTSHGRRRANTAQPATPLSRWAKIPALGQRAAVFTAACALLVGVGAAGQASATPAPQAASESQAAPAMADAEAKLSFEKAEVQVHTAPTAAPAPIAVAPQAAEPAPAPAVAVNDPAGAKAYAAGQLASFGWSADQMQCLSTLWTKESDWTTTATNASSGAYGVVQSLPAEKMASAGADYLTNYRTQINWGLDYIKKSYQSPCGALNFHLSHNWY
ncbi:MAG TPA: hypothetical protein VIM40_07490 [Arthrobacter sp.]